MDTRTASDDMTIALFLDAENLTAGSVSAGLPFDVGLLVDRVREEGQLIFARAYADWTRPGMLRWQREFQDNVVELAQLPTDSRGKNTADMQLAVDALEMSLLPVAPRVMVIASGDRDFVPLVQKLKRYGRFVIGLGLRGSTSRALATVCQEFIYYDTLVPEQEAEAEEEAGALARTRQAARQRSEGALTQAYELLVSAVAQIKRQGRIPLGSNTKLMMQRLDPDFDLATLGVSSFKDFILQAKLAGYAEISGQHGLDITIEALREPQQQPGELMQRYDFKFDTPERALESYLEILKRKRVPLLPWAQREELVRHLWTALEGAGEAGLAIADMTSSMERYAAQKDLHIPVVALQKITYTLNIGKCFARDGEPTFEHELFDTKLTAAVGVEEALRRMNLTYLTGILRFSSEIVRRDDALAQLLFDEASEENQERIRILHGQIETTKSVV